MKDKLMCPFGNNCEIYRQYVKDVKQEEKGIITKENTQHVIDFYSCHALNTVLGRTSDSNKLSKIGKILATNVSKNVYDCAFIDLINHIAYRK